MEVGGGERKEEGMDEDERKGWKAWREGVEEGDG